MGKSQVKRQRVDLHRKQSERKKSKKMVKKKKKNEESGKMDSPRNGKLIVLPIFFSTEDSEYKFKKEVSTHKNSSKQQKKMSLPQPPPSQTAFFGGNFLLTKSLDAIAPNTPSPRVFASTDTTDLSIQHSKSTHLPYHVHLNPSHLQQASSDDP